MEDDEMNAELAQKLEDILQRIELEEKSTLLKCVQELDSLKEQKIQLEANKIYADKELEATEENKSNENQQETDKVVISKDINELHSGLENHRLFHNLAQKMLDNLKIQDAVFSSLKAMNVDETVDHFPERADVLNQYGQNMNMSTKLVEVIDKKTQLENDILNHKVKYCFLLNQIKQKWKVIEEKSTGEYNQEDDDSPGMIKFLEKIKERTDKLRVMAVIIQSLITCTDLDWGTNHHLLQTLVLCDCALSLSKQKNIQNEIQLLQNILGQGSDTPRT